MIDLRRTESVKNLCIYVPEEILVKRLVGFDGATDLNYRLSKTAVHPLDSLENQISIEIAIVEPQV